jgi:hypothetical protein
MPVGVSVLESAHISVNVFVLESAHIPEFVFELGTLCIARYIAAVPYTIQRKQLLHLFNGNVV